MYINGVSVSNFASTMLQCRYVVVQNITSEAESGELSCICVSDENKGRSYITEIFAIFEDLSIEYERIEYLEDFSLQCGTPLRLMIISQLFL